MHSSVSISEKDGLTLTLAADPDRHGVLIATLTGTEFSAAVIVDCEPILIDAVSGKEVIVHDWWLPDFFASAAHQAADVRWSSLDEDLDLRFEWQTNGAIALYVYMGSTSDDACNWQVNATLQVSQDALSRCAEQIAAQFCSRHVLPK